MTSLRSRIPPSSINWGATSRQLEAQTPSVTGGEEARLLKLGRPQIHHSGAIYWSASAPYKPPKLETSHKGSEK